VLQAEQDGWTTQKAESLLHGVIWVVIRAMKPALQIAVIVVPTIASVLLQGCAAPRQLYDGEERPREEVALLRLPKTSGKLLYVRGVSSGGDQILSRSDALKGGTVALLPGEYTVEATTLARIGEQTESGGWSVTRTGVRSVNCRMVFEARPGEKYRIIFDYPSPIPPNYPETAIVGENSTGAECRCVKTD